MLASSPANVKRLGRLQPGKLFLVDLEQGRIVEDEEVKREVATQQPYGDWFARARRALRRPRAGAARAAERAPLRQGQLAFGYTQEDLRVLHRADGARGRGADRLDGQRRRARRPLRPPPAAVHLLQAALRAGHQPADRPDPRVDRHVARHRRRRRGQPARPRRPSTPTSWCMDQPILRNHELETLRRVSTDVFQRAHDRHHLAGRRGPDGHAEAPGRRLRRGPRRDRGRASTSSSSPTAPSGPSARRSRRCSPSPPCTTTSCARARACGRASCSSPASRARSTTSRR